ncbi:MAG: hypothetical protein QGF59_21185, partial [Pirellulaceae bacterium]|nr:hypothetical protein [Pirellulaceae bacterium]
MVRRFHRAVQYFASFMLVMLAFCQSTAHAQENISVEELARQLNETQRRLQQTELELRSLRDRDAQRQQWEASVLERLPSVDPGLDTVSYGGFEDDPLYEVDLQDCPDCGKSGRKGKAHLCDLCRAGAPWAKNHGWSIVPFGMLRGELIYAQQEQAADAVIFFLGPENVGVNDDQFTAHGKTSMLNFAITGPSFGSWQTGGAFVMNFTGSQPLRNTSGPQVLNAYGEVKNENWRFAFGRMFDLFSPITPSTVNMGQQRAAGNVGIYRGAMQLDRYINVSEEARWTLSGRISQPVANDFLLLPTARG